MAKKLTMNMVAIGNLKHRKKQYITLILSIFLAMTFACGAPLFLSSIESSRELWKLRQSGAQDEITVHAQNVAWEDYDCLVDGEMGFAHSILYGWTGDRQDRGTPVAWMDNQARAFYHFEVKEGTWPENPGEIAMETGALLRMGLEPKPGQTITLHTASMDGKAGEDRSFTLVGILYDHRSNLEKGETGERLERVSSVPAAFVCPEEPTIGTEDLTAFYKSHWRDFSLEYKELYEAWSKLPNISTRYYNYFGGASVIGRMETKVYVSVILSLLVAFLCCCGIVNAFAGNLQERKNQIGMLRAIGATRRQILALFGREAAILCLLTAPVSLSVACFGVSLVALVMGDSFVFRPDWQSMLMGMLLSVCCVMASALVPLVMISRTSPMQAIRDVEKMRKMKHCRIHSQNNYRLSRLLAKRKLLFTRGRQILVGLILGIAVFLGCLCGGLLQAYRVDVLSSVEDADYRVQLSVWSRRCGPFVNNPQDNPEISESERMEILGLPGVEQVTGEAPEMTMLMNIEEWDDYILLNDYMENYMVFAPEKNLPPKMEEVRTLFEEGVKTEDYLEIQNMLGSDFTHMYTAAFTEDRIEALEDVLLEGEIHPDKLNRGEEILMSAPQKIGAHLEVLKDGGCSFGLLNLDYDNMDTLEQNVSKEYMDHIWGTAERPFQVGDTVTLSMVMQTPEGGQTVVSRDVRIGGFVGKHWRDHMGVYTTIEGLRNWYADAGYRKLGVYVAGDCDPELDRQMTEYLEIQFPSFHVLSQFAANQQFQEEYRMFFAAICAGLVMLIAASSWLINNGVTAQIRQETRSIGTLRAVGAQPRDLIRSYLIQISTVIFWAALAGFLGTLLWWIFEYQYIYSGSYRPDLVLWPGLVTVGATLILCMGNLWIQVRKLSKQSIVENIRELG